MTSFMVHPYIRVIIHQSSDERLPMYAPMAADVGLFKAAEALTNM